MNAVLAAVLATSTPATAQSSVIPLPGEPGYSVAKAFVAIARRHEEVNVVAISRAFGLPDLVDNIKWRGPLVEWEEPRFFAYYDPPKSAVGVTKIVITWRLNSPAGGKGRPTITQSLRIIIDSQACPTEAEMVAVTGVPIMEMPMLGYDGGPSTVLSWFPMLDDGGGDINIGFTGGQGCELSTSYEREW